MQQPDQAIMERETVLKEDGRTLIYYRFVPQSEQAPEAAAAEAPIV